MYGFVLRGLMVGDKKDLPEVKYVKRSGNRKGKTRKYAKRQITETEEGTPTPSIMDDTQIDEDEEEVKDSVMAEDVDAPPEEEEEIANDVFGVETQAMDIVQEDQGFWEAIGGYTNPINLDSDMDDETFLRLLDPASSQA